MFRDAKPGLIRGDELLSMMRKELGRGFNMLLHAAITHSDTDCPLYDHGDILPVVDVLKKRDDLAEKQGITLYWMVSGAPEHVLYALLESDHIDKVTQFLHEVFITPSAFKIAPIQLMKDVVPLWSQNASGSAGKHWCFCFQTTSVRRARTPV